MEYNSFGQLISDYQEHAAVVSVGTSPKVGYGYADGSAGHVRPTRVTYPNGRVLRYEYHAGTDDAFNRPSFLADDHAGQLGWRLAEYAYLGLGQVIEMHHEEPDLLFTLAHGMEADPYDGLDRFDRTVDMRWTCCMGGYSGSGSSGDPGDCEAELVEQVCYGYDRASNRTHRRMPIAAAWGTNLDELYGYDRLHRLVDFDRGKLIRDDDLIDPLARKAQWTLDATGNWSRFRRFDQHDADAALDQTRGHNGANEVTDIAETVGRVWISPTHDRAGNMLILPRPSDPRESYIATYDAWHRLVKLTQSDGAGGLEPVAEYAYDGRNFRTVKQTYAAGELIAARHSYYSSQWQVLEERLDDSPAAACQYVWGERYIDDLVLRDRDTAGDGLLDERFYALQDANWNVIAISDPYCQIQERYAYDAYGTPAVHNAAFTPIATSAYAWPYTYTGRRLDEESALMYYRNRMYHAELGRFVSRDPVGMVQNAALYAYAHGSPLGKTDSLGLWGSDVHRGRTFDLAAQAGYPMNAARTIGDWNEDVDWFATSWGPGWAPIVGKQSYHFNRNLSAGGGADTRIMHKVKHFIEATKTCSEKNDPDEAAKHLGVALHPLQDFYAHGDYGINDTIPNGGNWIVHNQYSPQSPLPGKPNLASYPDDPALDAVGGPGGRPAGPAMRERTFEWAGPNFVADYAIYRRGTQRIRDTEAATSELLVDFRRFLERLPDGRGCNCRQFFGVR
ncbi:MAG: RHS repeat-associated core domain-containing protein [Thermoguttaceae bacterium]|jgi:RHS repeat-associated protein|nr:RHS repeat-associated core domain-containing protein [Thermoguttaceae bacterium]